ncbi:MAG TPA: nucleotidyltransferase family protein [Acidimicrobiia bacterium]|nr:nucleotidyltransferase family protein [Acidimicrobiia bacterium]
MTHEMPLRLHGIWPSASEELVIRAALASPQDAPALWAEWLETNDIDRLSFGTFRLLPLLYTKLAAADYHGNEMSKLRGTYRQSWYRNQLLGNSVAEMLDALHDRGIPTLLMKGIPLALRTYEDLGARSMGDGDIMVPLSFSSVAREVLEDHGWERTIPYFPGHAMSYRSGKGLEIDLHWYLTKYHQSEAVSDVIWQASMPFELNSVSTRAMNHTDELVHSLIHGLHWEQELPIRWVPDSFLIMERHAEDIDWERFLAVAGILRGSATVAAALTYLQSKYDAPVPAGVVDALESKTVVSQRVENWFRFHATARHPWGMLPLRWIAYWRAERERARIPTPVGFVRQLKTTWAVPSWTGMIGEVLRRVRRRLSWFARSKRRDWGIAPETYDG